MVTTIAQIETRNSGQGFVVVYAQTRKARFSSTPAAGVYIEQGDGEQ